DIQGRRPGQIGKTEPQITLMMSEDWNVVAVFREAIVDAKTLKFIWDPNRPGGPGYTPLAVDELNVAVGDQAYALAQDYQSNGAIYAWDHNHWINTDATDADCDGVNDDDDDTNGTGQQNIVNCILAPTAWPSDLLKATLNIHCSGEALIGKDAIDFHLHDALVVEGIGGNWLSGTLVAEQKLKEMHYF